MLGIEQLPLDWLIEQEVPLLFFVIALLTKPTQWSDAVVTTIKNHFKKES